MIVQDCLASYVCGISWTFLRVITNQLGMQEIIFLSKMSILTNDNLFWIRYGIIDNYTDISSILCSSQYKECTSFLNVEWYFEDIMSVCTKSLKKKKEINILFLDIFSQMDIWKWFCFQFPEVIGLYTHIIYILPQFR